MAKEKLIEDLKVFLAERADGPVDVTDESDSSEDPWVTFRFDIDGVSHDVTMDWETDDE